MVGWPAVFGKLDILGRRFTEHGWRLIRNDPLKWSFVGAHEGLAVSYQVGAVGAGREDWPTVGETARPATNTLVGGFGVLGCRQRNALLNDVCVEACRSPGRGISSASAVSEVCSDGGGAGRPRWE